MIWIASKEHTIIEIFTNKQKRGNQPEGKKSMELETKIDDREELYYPFAVQGRKKLTTVINRFKNLMAIIENQVEKGEYGSEMIGLRSILSKLLNYNEHYFE
ncbi:hypothetical protein RclHR1_04510019 [Rhizophagus clarus]|uniref:Uncharacterized protein n=1 Tax=Rhizophagus clarus TaxID=94130 RepID=A0A2Z6SBL8_9GLOM|nr:hypothetical protein RclHR1_04510019 [Rhizophagus clarus]